MKLNEIGWEKSATSEMGVVVQFSIKYSIGLSFRSCRVDPIYNMKKYGWLEKNSADIGISGIIT